MLIVLAVGLVFLVRWLQAPGTLPIRTVRVEGGFRHLDPERLKQLALPWVRGGFFNVRLHALEKSLNELPWVKSVSIRRRWPDTVIIQVQEQQPIAQWGDDGLLNAQGQVFRPAPDTFPKGLPRLSGPEGSERQLVEHFIAADHLLQPVGLQPVGLQEDARRAWDLRLASGIRIAVGRDGFDARLAQLAEIFPAVLKSRKDEIASIDLRYTNGLAVGWKTDAAQAGPTKEMKRGR